MKISKDDVRYVAKLARLQLVPAQIQKMSETFNDILAYMDTLNHVDTTDILPTSHVVKVESLFRNDDIHESLPLEEALQNAPDRVGAFYRVPKIIE